MLDGLGDRRDPGESGADSKLRPESSSRSRRRFEDLGVLKPGGSTSVDSAVGVMGGALTEEEEAEAEQPDRLRRDGVDNILVWIGLAWGICRRVQIVVLSQPKFFFSDQIRFVLFVLAAKSKREGKRGYRVYSNKESRNHKKKILCDRGKKIQFKIM